MPARNPKNVTDRCTPALSIDLPKILHRKATSTAVVQRTTAVFQSFRILQLWYFVGCRLDFEAFIIWATSTTNGVNLFRDHPGNRLAMGPYGRVDVCAPWVG